MAKSFYSDVIGEKKIIHLKTFSAKESIETKPDMPNFACSAAITLKR